MCSHGHIGVQVDTEVPNRADGHDIVGADAEWYGRNLILASAGRAPQHFGLLGVQLLAVAPHPCGHITNTGRDGVL